MWEMVELGLTGVGKFVRGMTFLGEILKNKNIFLKSCTFACNFLRIWRYG
jgi:hypothetical protein